MCFTFSGTARGCGWQKIGAYINLGSYYLVGIPLAIVFSFVIHIGGKVKKRKKREKKREFSFFFFSCPFITISVKMF